jgi:hypothetical protein
MNEKAYSKFEYPKLKKNHYFPNDDKSYQTKSSDKSYQTKSSDKSYQTKSSDKSYQTKSSDESYKYTPQQKAKYDNPYYNTSKYPQEQKNDKSTKQEKPRSVYKYKIEHDKSGNCSYVLEEPVHNPIKVINDYEIKCIYPNNGTKYYKNVNIYNYKKKIII